MVGSVAMTPTLRVPRGRMVAVRAVVCTVLAGLFVLTLEGDAVSAITWFGDTTVFRHFGL